ncbi:hypothetical protein J5N97_010761 [Dioscorea zingiberensis]|uniref:Bifunctional inhibitor/plant lipid transfer protein/seed storage helical domain-containing protein n=1 Tax=Dioscorea zingiberensis TaxID=325984 RepID=A0A9D5CZB7_9LILI|nr:hypothetical protein J5N97_010761 [Dioscorea zingiberensis]
MSLSSLAVMIMAMLMAINVSGQQPTCMPAITSLSPCLGFISGNGTATGPSPVCCSQLASVLTSQAQCLCSVLNGTVAAQIGLILNQTQALALPGACNLQAPQFSQCNAVAGAPAATPAISPVGAPAASVTPTAPAASVTPTTPSVSGNQSPATPSVPSTVPAAAGKGSNNVPSKTSQSSDGVLLKSVHPLVVVLLAFACSFSIKL